MVAMALALFLLIPATAMLLGVFIAAYPARLMRLVLRAIPLAPTDPVMGALSRRWPISWLTSGSTWHETTAHRTAEPEQLPRLMRAIRFLGVLLVAVAVLFSALAVVGIAAD